MENLIIKINDKEFKAEFVKNDDSTIFINNHQYKIELLKKYSTNIFSFSVNNKICQIEIDFNESGSSFISLDGFSHEIEVTNETKMLLQKYLSESSSAVHKSAKLKAPMPGMVVKILKDEGQHVEKGEKIIILEAMKMENSLSSPITGIIKSIKVREGIAVEKDAFLAEIEAE